jgi:hypothetical protein
MTASAPLLLKEVRASSWALTSAFPLLHALSLMANLKQEGQGTTQEARTGAWQRCRGRLRRSEWVRDKGSWQSFGKSPDLGVRKQIG